MNTGSEHAQPQAKDTGENVQLPPVHKTREELMHMHAKELLQMLDERNIDHTAVVEKPEIIDLILAKCTH
ncbi:hypothetical protein BGZ97_005030 [Linnemannia gamsii]|jgi:hypothetical protein|uniref:Uncharacterized protein n=1 Tax=Linnemannia gamsii TaxID=64522 RepID=A0A9P6UGP2_9FUNG|nr:hypothetical protein BGZ97_005030 [Linnemannia gamsii]